MLHASQHVYALMISSTAWQLRPYFSSPSALWWFFFFHSLFSWEAQGKKNKCQLALETPAQWCTMSEAGIWQAAIGGLQLWIGSTTEGGWQWRRGVAVQWRLLTGRQQVWVKKGYTCSCAEWAASVSDISVCFCVIGGLLVKQNMRTVMCVDCG